LVPPPPWHFAGDVLAVEFWNDPDVSVHTLPAGVELDKKCPSHAVALFTDYQFTAQRGWDAAGINKSTHFKQINRGWFR
jgi:hypothetical protein